MISKIQLSLVPESTVSLDAAGYQAQFFSELSGFLSKNKIHANLCGPVIFGHKTLYFKVCADKPINPAHIQHYFSAPLYAKGWRLPKGKRRVFHVTII